MTKLDINTEVVRQNNPRYVNMRDYSKNGAQLEIGAIVSDLMDARMVIHHACDVIDELRAEVASWKEACRVRDVINKELRDA